MVIRLSLGAYDQACSRLCERDDVYGAQARLDWGCEKDAEREVDRIDCFACEDGYERDDITKVCGHCLGKGSVPVMRCPRRTATPEWREVVRYLMWAHRGQWPVDGGLGEQSATFVTAMEIFEEELARYQEIQSGGHEGNSTDHNQAP